MALIAEGFKAGLLEVEAVGDIETYGPVLNAYMQERFKNVQARAASQAGAQLSPLLVQPALAPLLKARPQRGEQLRRSRQLGR